MSSEVESTAQPRPWGVWAIVGVVAVEGLLLLAVAVYGVVSLLTLPQHGVGGGIFLAVLCTLFGASLLVVSANVLRGYRWTRSIVLVWQLVMIAVIVSFATSGPLPVMFGALVPLAVVVLLFSPRVVSATIRTGDPSTL